MKISMEVDFFQFSIRSSDTFAIFIQHWKIRPFFYNNFVGFWGELFHPDVPVNSSFPSDRFRKMKFSQWKITDFEKHHNLQMYFQMFKIFNVILGNLPRISRLRPVVKFCPSPWENGYKFLVDPEPKDLGNRPSKKPKNKKF